MQNKNFYDNSSSGASTTTKPNILFILTDQQSATMMSCAGNPDLETPAMDWLSEHGVRFERAYPTNPVCLPARFSFQTGCYPSMVGIRSNPDGAHATPFPDFRNNTLGHKMRDAGYDTAYGGKVHLPGGLGMDDVTKLGYEVLTKNSRDGLTKECTSFIKRERESPFFLFASFVNPHDICYMGINDHRRSQGEELVGNIDSQICEEVLAEAPTNEEDLPEIEGVLSGETGGIMQNQPEAMDDFLKQRAFKQYIHTHWDEKKWRQHKWLYARLTERVDRQIGTVLEALEESNQLENTLIIFTSDHGDVDGAHGMEHKSVFFEEALRVPFIVTQKGVTSSQVDSRHFINNGLDLFPTVCDYADIDPPEGLLGESIRPLVEGKEPSQWRDVCVVESEIGKYLITDRWKYCRLDFSGEEEEALVDMQNDPNEMTNLAPDPAYKEKLEELRQWLADWEKETGVTYAGEKVG